MAQSLTDWLQQNRFTVVGVDKSQGRLRIKGDTPACTDLDCGADLEIVSDDGISTSLEALNQGDVVKVETDANRARRIVVVRRVWDELTSPEF